MGLAEYCFISVVSHDTVKLSMRGKEPLALLLCVVPWLACFEDGSRPPATAHASCQSVGDPHRNRAEVGKWQSVPERQGNNA